MSNMMTEASKDYILDEVESLWSIPDRQDLKNDLLEYIEVNFAIVYEQDIKDIMIQWLQQKIFIAGNNIYSHADIDKMAESYLVKDEDNIGDNNVYRYK